MFRFLRRWLGVSKFSTAAEAWEILREFQFPVGYHDRLAREQSWDRAKVDAVVAEYKRFLALAATADKKTGFAVPAKEVDEAWHLHMLYTASYWTKLCQEVLEKEIHHHPFESTDDAGYRNTMIRYRNEFWTAPPVAIWGAFPFAPVSTAVAKSGTRSQQTGRTSTTSARDGGDTNTIMFFNATSPPPPPASGGHSTGLFGGSADAGGSGASCGSSSSSSCGGGGGGSSCGGGGGGCGGGS